MKLKHKTNCARAYNYRDRACPKCRESDGANSYKILDLRPSPSNMPAKYTKIGKLFSAILK